MQMLDNCNYVNSISLNFSEWGGGGGHLEDPRISIIFSNYWVNMLV